jgi:hypothetical protein
LMLSSFSFRTSGGVVGTAKAPARARNPARRAGGAAEIRKLPAALAFERPEPAVRRPRERPATDRTRNGARRRGCPRTHIILPRCDTVGSPRRAALSPFEHPP